jgi:hypothetical protein
MAEFMGKDGFVWWQGVVEDRYDPWYLGRCRIRILGWHTEDKTDMPTESLPWAYPIQPITSAAQTGVGISPTGPVEGTWVVGFYRDGEQAQEPVFFGTLGGIPSLDSKIPPNEGFADPRGDTTGPVHPQLKKLKKDAPRDLLTFDAKDPERNIPYPPLEIKHYLSQTEANTAIYPTGDTKPNNKKNLSAANAKGTVNVVLEEQMNRSTYPRTEYLGEPTTPREARGVFGTPAVEYAKGIHGQKNKNWALTGGSSGFPKAKVDVLLDQPPPLGTGEIIQSRGTWQEPQPATLYGAVYPYNHVHLSESGHLTEIDDTPDNERLHRYHRTGTYEEIGSLGQRIVKVVNENYHMGLNDDHTSIKGNKYLNITQTLDIVSSGGYFHDSGKSPITMTAGSFSMSFPGSAQFFSVNPTGGIIIDAGDAPITLKGSSLNKDFKDGSQTDAVKGGFTQKVGGLHSLEAGSISLATKGSTGITSGGALNILATGNITETIVNLSLPPAAAARETLALLGDINFNSATGSVNLDSGRIPLTPGGTGLFSSLAVTPSGISMSALVALSTLDITASGIELKALGGLASISVSASGIELSYLASSIKLGPAGITLEGVLIKSSASGINTVEGSLVKLN